METTDTVSSNLRALMGMKKKTITKLALKLGVARQTAGLYFNGNKAMTSDQLAIVANWLEVEVGELFREDVYATAA